MDSNAYSSQAVILLIPSSSKYASIAQTFFAHSNLLIPSANAHFWIYSSSIHISSTHISPSFSCFALHPPSQLNHAQSHPPEPSRTQVSHPIQRTSSPQEVSTNLPPSILPYLIPAQSAHPSKIIVTGNFGPSTDIKKSSPLILSGATESPATSISSSANLENPTTRHDRTGYSSPLHLPLPKLETVM